MFRISCSAAALTWALAYAAGSVLAAPVHQAGTQIINGAIFPDGSALVGSALYSSVRVKTGKYEVSFNSPLHPIANCLAIPFAQSPAPARLNGLFLHKKSCIFEFQDLATGAPVDTYFTFIALPMSD
jgi:hypothetical protein